MEEVHQRDRETSVTIFMTGNCPGCKHTCYLNEALIVSEWRLLRPLCRICRSIKLWPSGWHLLHFGYTTKNSKYVIGVFWDILSHWINQCLSLMFFIRLEYFPFEIVIVLFLQRAHQYMIHWWSQFRLVVSSCCRESDGWSMICKFLDCNVFVDLADNPNVQFVTFQMNILCI